VIFKAFLILLLGGLPLLADSSYLNPLLQEQIAPHLLPTDHPINPMLDQIFSNGHATDTPETLREAGFVILNGHTGSFVTVASHPAIPGYIFKLYLNSETRHKIGKPERPYPELLISRCIGAKKIKNLILKKQIQHFIVPDKWIYPLPFGHLMPQSIILVETEIPLADKTETTSAWKSRITKKHLDELYAILKPGYGSTSLVNNVPYTKTHQFAFIDTEYPRGNPSLKEIKDYLSEEMRTHWKSLLKKS
jgi:hypothetical protein